MKFDASTILQELKALKDKPTAELVFDWSIMNAWANKLKTSKKQPDFLGKKFGSEENFRKYATALYTELKRRNVNVKLDGHIKDYVDVTENSIIAIDLYSAAEELGGIPVPVEVTGLLDRDDPDEVNDVNDDSEMESDIEIDDTYTGMDADDVDVIEIEAGDDTDDDMDDDGDTDDIADMDETDTEDVDTETNGDGMEPTNEELSALLEQLEQLPNLVLKRNFIRLVGSSVSAISDMYTRPDDESDVDIYVDMPNEDVPTWIHKKLHLMLSKLFEKPVQLIYQNPDVNGPTEDSIVLYDLVLVKHIEYEPAYIDETIELSKGTLTFKDIKIPKPYKVVYGLDNISVKDIPFTNYIIQPKYNGMRVVIFNGGKVVYSKDGNKLPLDLSFIFANRVPDNYVFTGEVWSDTLPRQIVIGKAKKGELDKELTVTIYGVLNPNVDYRTQLQLIKKYIKQKYRVKNFTSLNEAIQYVSKHPEFDGIVIKNLDATSSDRKYFMKVKKEADVDVQVLKRMENKNGTYKYEVGYLDGNTIQPFGETFSTKQKFNPGDIIEVSCYEISLYNDGSVKGYAIRVKGPSGHDKPYTKKEILKVAKDGGILNIIQKSE